MLPRVLVRDEQVLREAGVGPDEMDKPAPGGDQESDVEERPDPLEVK